MLLSFRVNMGRILSILIVAAGLLIFAVSALACGCETSGSQKKDFELAKNKAASIFVGRAVEVADVITHSDFSERRVNFRAERYWKGQFNEEVIVFTGRNDCASHFVVGDEYLVLAYVLDGDLYTDICMKTGLVRHSAGTLKRLGKGKRSSTTRRSITTH
jgi:hypothetical protein